jgi:hypothetical protein
MEEDVQIAVEEGGRLTGKLRCADEGLAAVILVRREAGDSVLADALFEHGFTTLTIDLLTRREAFVDRITGHLRTRVPLLARRISAAAGWLRSDRRTESLPIACFAHGIGAAAALVAAAESAVSVMGVVACDVRADLVRDVLARVRVPVLFLAFALDPAVLAITRSAFDAIAGPADVVLIPARTADENGAPEAVARATRRWLEHHPSDRQSSPRPMVSPSPA